MNHLRHYKVLYKATYTTLLYKCTGWCSIAAGDCMIARHANKFYSKLSFKTAYSDTCTDIYNVYNKISTSINT